MNITDDFLLPEISQQWMILLVKESPNLFILPHQFCPFTQSSYIFYSFTYAGNCSTWLSHIGDLKYINDTLAGCLGQTSSHGRHSGKDGVQCSTCVCFGQSFGASHVWYKSNEWLNCLPVIISTEFPKSNHINWVNCTHSARPYSSTGHYLCTHVVKWWVGCCFYHQRSV